VFPALSVNTWRGTYPDVAGLVPLLSLTLPGLKGSVCSSRLGTELAAEEYPPMLACMNCLMYYSDGGHASKDYGSNFGI